ncbi:unnamed protein product [Vitrella brassicaformis CCMP3155]|uniref:Uncharacterized protein n=2 Tax=Vitrella brassicaformis TaxID=1169539 RepID=A0A0G4FP17_VITBC|nr:unnamed protein product [Vitrella brassicaformis CCMP3155]|mmetsp:Transcript_4341/g.9924  ORF Transcript_4341/g.9924 Transcript_4341/m.9924 type:complete len:1144 (+) Transcript_4341:250-3681(+)|eukprot:CEM15808.1 unnamed protein product [Vitrella brassicaformis CCMP3155]
MSETSISTHFTNRLHPVPSVSQIHANQSNALTDSDSEANKRDRGTFNDSEEGEGSQASSGREETMTWTLVLLRLCAQFYDVRSLLTVRMCCRRLYHKTWTVRQLNFSGFQGYDPAFVTTEVLPLVLSVTDETAQSLLNLSKLNQLKDPSIALILTLPLKTPQRTVATNVRMLAFDFCHFLTDKGLETMLTTHMPRLEHLSMKCCRSKDLTGAPILEQLTKDRWPAFHQFSGAFTRLSLGAVERVAHFIIERSRALKVHPRIGMCGTWAMKSLIDKVRLEPHRAAFEAAVHRKDLREAERAIQAFEQKWEEVAEDTEFKKYYLLHLMKHKGGNVLVNSPCSCHYGECDSWAYPLTVAIENRDGPMVKLLLSAGAKLDIWDFLGRSPMSVACETNQLDICTTLLMGGGSPNPYSLSCISPMEHAIRNENCDMIDLLIKRGAVLDAAAPAIKTYKSPLFIACEGRSRLLVHRSHHRPNPLAAAAGTQAPHSSPPSPPSPLSPADVETTTSDPPPSPPPPPADVQQDGAQSSVASPVTARCSHTRRWSGYRETMGPAASGAAAGGGHGSGCNIDEIIIKLLQAGGNPNWSDPSHYTPTLLAYQQNPSWLETFLDFGAGSRASKRWVLTDVLTCAILRGNLKGINTLVSRHPDLLHREHPLWSLPHIQAARLGRAKVLAFLIERGVDVNARGHDGLAAVHLASNGGFVECVKLLLRKGADVDLRDGKGRTALHIACLENRASVAEVLLTSGADVNAAETKNGETPLISSIRCRNHTMANLIMAKGQHLDYDQADSHGRTALMYSVYFGQYAIADLLVERGADPAKPDDSGNTPFKLLQQKMEGRKGPISLQLFRPRGGAEEGSINAHVGGFFNEENRLCQRLVKKLRRLVKQGGSLGAASNASSPSRSFRSFSPSASGEGGRKNPRTPDLHVTIADPHRLSADNPRVSPPGGDGRQICQMSEPSSPTLPPDPDEDPAPHRGCGFPFGRSRTRRTPTPTPSQPASAVPIYDSYERGGSGGGSRPSSAVPKTTTNGASVWDRESEHETPLPVIVNGAVPLSPPISLAPAHNAPVLTISAPPAAGTSSRPPKPRPPSSARGASSAAAAGGVAVAGGVATNGAVPVAAPDKGWGEATTASGQSASGKSETSP